MTLRPVNMNDAELLLRWRNDPSTRRWMNNTEIVSEEEHKTWLVHQITSPQIYLYIAEVEGSPVGTIRVMQINGEHYISYTIAPSERKKGYGKRMVEEIACKFYPIRAEIKPTNIPSIKIALHIGLELSACEHGLLFFNSPELEAVI